MKVAIIADVHLHNFTYGGNKKVNGINDRAAMILAAFKQALDVACDHECQAFVVAGDLFDVWCPEPSLIGALRELLNNYNRLDILLFPGNHDQRSLEANDNACYAVAASSPHIVVPYNPKGKYVYENTIAFGTMEQLTNTQQPLAILHTGIHDDTGPHWAVNTTPHVKNVMRTVRAPVIVAGDFHEPKQWKGKRSHVIIPGSLSPTSFSDKGKRGQVIIVDTDTLAVQSEWVSVPLFTESSKRKKSWANHPIVYVRSTEPIDAPDNVQVELVPKPAKVVAGEHSLPTHLPLKDTLAVFFESRETPERVQSLIWSSLDASK